LQINQKANKCLALLIICIGSLLVGGAINSEILILLAAFGAIISFIATLVAIFGQEDYYDDTEDDEP
jgi:uncharacterized membrane protein YiaA